MEPVLRANVFRENHERMYKLFLSTAIGRDNFVLTHPSFFYILEKNISQLWGHLVMDVSVYHPSFLIPLLLVARHFAKMQFQKRENISSNDATLLLCGTAGGGKSILLDMLCRFCKGYRWNDGNF